MQLKNKKKPAAAAAAAAAAGVVSEEDESLVAAAARKALFGAVEGEGSGGRRMRGAAPEPEPDNGDDDDEDDLHSPIPFLRLFSAGGGGSNTERDPLAKAGGVGTATLNARERRHVLCSAIENFSKIQARRFFSGLLPIVESVISSERYVPESVRNDNHRDGEDDGDGDGREEEKEEEQIQPDERSSECLQFLHYAALAVRTYVDAQADARKQKKKNKGKEGRSSSQHHHHHQQELSVVEEVYDVAVQLHDVLFELHSSCGARGAEPKSTIIGACERWWLHNCPNRERLILHILPLLACAAIGSTGDSNSENGGSTTTPTAAVKRLFGMRQALAVVDFADPSSESLKQMLLQLVSSPQCLKLSEGRRLIAYLMQVDDTDETLCRDVHLAIRAQLPDAKRSLLEAYGEIYLRAWKEAPATTGVGSSNADGSEDIDFNDGGSNSSVRSTIESEALTDLAYSALHSSKPATAKAVATVLEPLHLSKKSPEISSLLVRLYGPILYRSLSSANPSVRIQAARILAEVFPLCDANAGAAATSQQFSAEAAVNKACAALRSLMTDRVARVRVAGSEALASILSTFWDVLPPSEIRTLLNYVVAEHASDATCATVRASALNTVTTLLEAVPQAHGVLRPLLPPLGNLIHDRVEKVRLAVVRMLLRIKKTKGIKYYHVVSVQHLTARLADDGRRNLTGPVASSLTSLIANSCFPQGPKVTAAIQMERTITFLRNDPMAASVFYANISKHFPVDAIAKFAAMLLRCVHSAVEKERTFRGHRGRASGAAAKRRRVVDEDEEVVEEEEGSNGTEDGGEEDDSDQLVSAKDTAVMASLTETICTLWQSIEDKLRLPENQDSNEFLVESFSGRILMVVLQYFERQAENARSKLRSDDTTHREDCYRTCAAILRLAGRLPAKAVEGLVTHVSALLGSLPDSGAPAQNVTALIALLCLWDLTEEVATSIASSIESVFEADHSLQFSSPDSTTGKRRAGRSQRLKNNGQLAIPEMPSLAALNVLGAILRGSDPSSVAARQSILGSPTASRKIEKALERGTKYAESILVPGVNSVYSKNFLESEVEYISKACEAFGRFVLHKEAFSNVGVSFNEQARRLLDWTSAVVLPALLMPDNEKLPFNDPNLSRISVEKSFDFPVSPVPTGPPKRRSKRDKTPVRMHDNKPGARHSSLFESPSSSSSASPSTQDPPFSFVLAKAFAVSIMHSCVILFSEWLAVGGAGAEEIAAAAGNWTRLFKETASTEEGDAVDNEAIQRLVPAFCRLALQLCKTADNFSLLKSLLIAVREEDDEDGKSVLKIALSTLLSTRGHSSSVAKTVRCVLDAAHKQIETIEFTVPVDSPQSLRSICPDNSGSVLLALKLAVSSKQGSVELVKILVDSFGQQHTAPLPDNLAIFNAHCLSMICSSPDSAGLSSIVRSLDVSTLDEESKAVPVLRAIVDVGNAS